MSRLLRRRLRRLPPPEAGRADQIAGLLADRLRGVARPRVAVLLPASARLTSAIRAALPDAELVEAPPDVSERHVLLTATGPFDGVVDRQVGPRRKRAVAARRRRFLTTAYHLRAGGVYLVPGGASELGASPGALGRLLRNAEQAPEGSLVAARARMSLRTTIRIAVRDHVTAHVVGDHLVLSHDLPDVRVKLREDEFDALIADEIVPHRLLKVIPAGDPPAPPPLREGPEPGRPRTDRPITRAELRFREYRDVVVAPKQLVFDGRLLLPDSYRHNQWPVLRHDLMLDVAGRFAVPREPQPADPPRLEGTYLHLDNEHRGHFGHLMTESLSRTWTWPEALAIDPDVRVLVGATRVRPRPLEYEYLLMEACGIPRDRIDVIDSPVRVDRLLSGSPMFSHPEFVHPLIVDTWRRAGDALAAQAEDRERPRRIFIGRRSDKRGCINGAELEAEFIASGFEVIFPEDYSLPEQVALFRNAEVIGGYAGSALFQIAFVPEPTHLIRISGSTYRPRNEYLMAAVLGHRIDAVICPGEGRTIHASYRYDPDREGPWLRQILGELPPLES